MIKVNFIITILCPSAVPIPCQLIKPFLHKKRDGTNQSSSPHAPNVSSMNHYVKTKGVLVRKNYFKPFRLFKDMLGEN